ncbi:uncharacterized protein N7458_008864 [Penicillium daleae]|uniref:RGS domain-containing protein n=1 Tax=Penicillium daleae TaxID=63821 RepID=A0AAD6BVW1_9EURO|nr:uncharacterized protein N7458_008864 [Penicillium daleae]KAJ5437866.1 hypothetical protein N7458_008864 [Penicillium daleae]
MGSELGLDANSKAELNLTPVSIWWVCWTGIWTAVVGLGMVFLVIHRNSTPLRLRGIGLSLSAVILLHLYWITVQLGLLIGPLAPGNAEFWIMGTLLPCGIALFHASNSRFIHVANLQKRYTRPNSRLVGLPYGNTVFEPKGSKGLADRFRRLDYTTKSLITVGFAMLLQIFLTTLMYIISRKWHSSWGIPGTEIHGTAMEQKTEMGRGWEWWPGVFWQFFWSWIVAPVVLWKSRDIHDTHGWRVQTIGCAVARICLSIVSIEIFTVLLPCWEVYRHQSLRQETLDLIAEWESKPKSNPDIKSLKSATATVESMMSGSVKTDHSDESVMTMPALEYVLDRDPASLQNFSALHDFSGENIAFLTSVAQWKSSIQDPSDVEDEEDLKEMLQERFTSALSIYVEFVSPHAEFPINLCFQELAKLENIFEEPARTIYGDEPEINQIAPFDIPSFSRLPSAMSSDGSEKEIRITSSVLRDRVWYWGDVPEEFTNCGLGANVFDEAVRAVKYLVLTNTWPRFVRSQSTTSRLPGITGSGCDVELARAQHVK